MGPVDIQTALNKYQAHMRISAHNEINNAWGLTDPIIGYNTSECLPAENRENKLIIVGKFLEPDYNQIRQIQNMSPIPVEIIGDNNGLSKYMEWSGVLEKMSTVKYYLNISKTDALSTLMLQAMRAGCYIVTNNSPFTKGLFTKETGSYFNNMDKLLDILNNLHKSPPSNISPKNMLTNTACVSQWDTYLNNVYDLTYIRK